MKYLISLLGLLCFLACAPLVHAQCGTLPLVYCGKTDMGVYTGAAPTLGAAGTSTTDPDFGSKVLRVTQSSSCPNAPSTDSFTPNDGEGWKHSINKDDTKVLLHSDSEGWFYQGINPNASPVTTTGACVNITPGNVNNGPLGRLGEWSFVTANLLYGLSKTDFHFLASWDTVPGHAAVNIYDWTTTPGFVAGASPFRPLEIDDSDTWFCTMNGAQDNADAYQVLCYNQNTQATQLLDLHTATSKQNSSAPVALDNLSVAQLTNCVIHEITIGRDAQWIVVTLNSCTAFPNGYSTKAFWQLGTNHVTYIPSALFPSSHLSIGYVGAFISASGEDPATACGTFDARGWQYFFATDFGSAGSVKYVEAPACLNGNNPNTGTHQSWLNNRNDANVNRYPLISEAYNDVANSGKPWEWEVIALPVSAAYAAWQVGSFGTAVGTNPWRLAHTFNEASTTQCGPVVYESPNVSQDGRFVIFPSDWGGQTGTGTCTNKRRTDVFLLDAQSIAGGTNLPSGLNLGTKLYPGTGLR